MSLSVAVTPGYTFADGDILTPAILRAIASPVVNLQGTISSALIPDGGVTTQKIAPGALSANTAGRNLVANGFITLVMLGSGIFTADASGRAPFANGFVNNALLGTAAVDAANLTEAVAKQTYAYAVDTGTANNYAIALTPAPTSYVDGMVIRFKAVNANTAASTVNVNTIGAKALKKRGLALSAGNIPANAIVEAVYEATAGWFQIISVLAGVDFTGTGAVPAASGVLTIAHGLAAKPVRWSVVLLQNNAVAQQGYAQNDEVNAACFSGGGTPQFAVSVDATNVTIARLNNGNCNVTPKTGGAPVSITEANWLVKVYASL